MPGVETAIGIQPQHVTAAQVLDLARSAEDAGYRTIWTIEQELDSTPYNHAIAAATRSIVVGSAIARTVGRHPLAFAETAAAVDRFAPGRLVIGLGTAGARLDGKGVDRWGLPGGHAAARMEEYVDVLRAALSGEAVHYEGDHFSVDGVRLDPPASGALPVYLAAGGRRLAELCGRKADGMFTYLLGPDLFAETVATMRAAAEQAGRDPDSIPVCPLIPTCIADDRGAARAHLKQHLAWYLRRPYYRGLMERNGFAAAVDELVSLLAAGETEQALAALPDELVDAVAITGPPDDCRHQLERHASRGATLAILYVFDGGDGWYEGYARALETFAPGRLQ